MMQLLEQASCYFSMDVILMSKEKSYKTVVLTLKVPITTIDALRHFETG